MVPLDWFEYSVVTTCAAAISSSTLTGPASTCARMANGQRGAYGLVGMGVTPRHAATAFLALERAAAHLRCRFSAFSARRTFRERASLARWSSCEMAACRVVLHSTRDSMTQFSYSSRSRRVSFTNAEAFSCTREKGGVATTPPFSRNARMLESDVAHRSEMAVMDRQHRAPFRWPAEAARIPRADDVCPGRPAGAWPASG
eukprot:scaffold21265_cov131-Isochrysis_galbana.AAC.9